MNLQYIRYALEIARTGSISKAAENLSVAQPNLSRAVKELESQLGISIFERTRTGMTVTPGGEQLLSAGERILRDVSELETMFTGETRPRRGLTVTAMPAAYLSHALLSFCAALPTDERYGVTWKEATLNAALDDVTQGISKLGIIRIPLRFEGYYTELLTSRELKCETVAEYSPVIAVGQGSPIAAKETVTVADLAELCEVGCPESLPCDGSEGSRANSRREIAVEGTHTAYALISADTETFLCVPPIPTPALNQYGLTQRPLAKGTVYRDLLISPKAYRFTDTDEAFLRGLRGTVKHYMG